MGSVPTGESPSSMAVNPAGTRVFVTNSGSNSLQTYDLSSGLPVSLGAVPTGTDPLSIAVNSAGTRAFIVNFQQRYPANL